MSRYVRRDRTVRTLRGDMGGTTGASAETVARTGVRNAVLRSVSRATRNGVTQSEIVVLAVGDAEDADAEMQETEGPDVVAGKQMGGEVRDGAMAVVLRRRRCLRPVVSGGVVGPGVSGRRVWYVELYGDG